MLRIGITGGIGSGKSVVTQLFSVLGIPVFNADLVARQLMESDAELKQSIIGAFGNESYAGGKLDRKYLADIVFKDPFQLDLLNALVHPAAIAAAEQWAQQQQAPYVVKEAALFFESGSAAGMDYIIGVYAPRSLRLKRVMDRDGVLREEVLSRMNRQINEEMKMRLCDFVLQNDDRHLLIPQVLELHHRFLQENQQRSQ